MGLWRRGWVRGVCGLGLTLVFTGAPGQAQPLMQLAPPTVRQGQVIAITVSAPESTQRRTVRFAGRSWPLFWHAGTWSTYLGTDPTTRPGRYVVTFDAVTAQGTPLKARAMVAVVRVAFPTRSLAFGREQQALLSPTAAIEERKRTEAALRVVEAEQLWTGPFLLPVSGPISSPYGVLSIYQGQTWGFHTGVDIAVPEGTPVHAANNGIVRLAEALPLSGNAVLLDHGRGVITAYLHMFTISVAAGQHVTRGEVVGEVGTTGLSLGPHLHWGVRVNGVYVDPFPWTTNGQ